MCALWRPVLGIAMLQYANAHRFLAHPVSLARTLCACALITHLRTRVVHPQGGKSAEEVTKIRSDAIGPQGSALAPSTRRTVETHVLEFLRANRKMLPMYFLPGVDGMKLGGSRVR